MRFLSVVAGTERLVEVEGEGPKTRVSIWPGPDAQGEPRVLTLDVAWAGPDGLSLLDGLRGWECQVEPRGEGKLAVRVGGALHPVELLDEQRLRRRRASGAARLDGPQRIESPMPGKVVRVLVKKGDAVAEGQALCVVEAMKMENELRSGRAGTALEVTAVEGQAVETGALLVVVG